MYENETIIFKSELMGFDEEDDELPRAMLYNDTDWTQVSEDETEAIYTTADGVFRLIVLKF